MADGGLFEALYGNPPPPYSPRLVGYVDILGWTALTRDPREGDLARVEHGLSAMKAAGEFEANIRRDLVEVGQRWGETIRCTHFSDCMVFSCIPQSYEAWWLIRRVRHECELLLAAGHYTRGAISFGSVRHDETGVYGPALVEAVHLEQQVAVYPRIVVTDLAAQLLALQRPSPDFDGWSPLIEDTDGLTILELIRREKNGKRLPHIRAAAAELRKKVVADIELTKTRTQPPYGDQSVALNHRAKFGWMLKYLDTVLADQTVLVPGL